MTGTQKNYTRKPVAGKLPGRLLPTGTALVLEGGGTRGFYSSGVMDAFLAADIMFPYVIGVSAGAANALSYLSGQKGRSREIVAHYVAKPEYLSYGNLLRVRSLFGFDYVFNEVPEQHVFWDEAAYLQNPARLLTGVTDLATGECVWYEKEAVLPDLKVSRASCSVPVVSPIVRFDGRDLLDGGIAAPIPIEKSIADGNTFHVIVLTQNAGYRKKPFAAKALLKAVYGKYPRLIDTMLHRHAVYNRQIELCERLEAAGNAVIIRPEKPMVVGRTCRDTAKLLALYDEGEAEGAAAVPKILARCE